MQVLMHQQMLLPRGPGAIAWFTPPSALPPANATAVISTVRDEVGSIVSEHMLQRVTPEHLAVPAATVSFKVADDANADGTIDVAVTSDRVALWVTLTTLAHGRFTDNAFFLPATTKTVQFVPFLSTTPATLQSSLRIEDLSMYRSIPPPPPPPFAGFVQLPPGIDCAKQGNLDLTAKQCSRAALFFGFKDTGTRARPQNSGCFAVASGPYQGNVNFNSNASAACCDPGLRSICARNASMASDTFATTW
jgi:hypothetical protein